MSGMGIRTAISFPLKRAFANVNASSTDASVVDAVPGKRIQVCAVVFVCGGTATNATFNTKPSGAGSAISALFANAANGGAVLPFAEAGWFATNVGEGLSLTTGSGSATGVQVIYMEV